MNYHGVFDLLRISIHTLREEGDSPRKSYNPCFGYFYPRPPRGGRRGIKKTASLLAQISIHALREEGDSLSKARLYGCKGFLSTPSARRATFRFRRRVPREGISIHALREEGDSKLADKIGIIIS